MVIAPYSAGGPSNDLERQVVLNEMNDQTELCGSTGLIIKAVHGFPGVVLFFFSP